MFRWVKSDSTWALMVHVDRQLQVVTVQVGPWHRAWEYGKDDWA